MPTHPWQLLALTGLWLTGCPAGLGGKPTDPPPARATSTDPADEAYVGPTLPRAKVVLTDAFGGKHRVEVEVAATAAARERGLMWRRQLAEGQGMLFIFPEEGDLSFWMRNTFIPLDLIFIGKDRVVVGIVPQAPPQTLTSRSVGGRSLYVLEVPGGWSEKVGLKAGSSVELEGTSLIQVQP
jgi:uncharacterized membrane protein (UPF0127 family)